MNGCRRIIEEGRHAQPLAALRPHVSGGARALIRTGVVLTPEDAAYPALQKRFLDLYQAHICEQTCLFPGMEDLLVSLESRGIKWGIVTNKVERYTVEVVRQLGLSQRAACVVSGDSAPRPKPAPDPLLLACQQAGVAAERCHYVGDDLRDVQAGKAAGMITVVAAWGYLGDGAPAESWGGDHIVIEPGQILDLI